MFKNEKMKTPSGYEMLSSEEMEYSGSGLPWWGYGLIAAAVVATSVTLYCCFKPVKKVNPKFGGSEVTKNMSNVDLDNCGREFEGRSFKLCDTDGSTLCTGTNIDFNKIEVVQDYFKTG